jgi:CelD/BcsL family acetyltransferase involved in cellulose biosynthesis
VNSSATSQTEGEYAASWARVADAATLEDDWRVLQAKVHPPVFLDWLWIGTWLDSYRPDAIVVRITLSGQLVALGVFCRQAHRRHKVLHSHIAFLHQTDLPEQDQIWIEYNGLLALAGHETAALALAIQTIQNEGLCDEVHLSMLPSEQARALHSKLPDAHIEYEACGFQTDLRSLRRRQATVMDSLSSNTRHQIRRSLRRYEGDYDAPMQVVPAGTTDEAIHMFQQCAQWHRARWADSGFNNPAFTDFHEKLIKRGFGHGSAQLFRIVVGEHVIGVFYFLFSKRRVYFYLQGIESESDGKLKPGLSAHLLLMQYFLDQGYDMYDFMGGESQYKRQLATQQNAFTTLRVHNGGWRFRIEDKARRLKQRLLGS